MSQKHQKNALRLGKCPCDEEYVWRCFRQIWNQLALGMWWVNKKNGAKVDIEWMRCKSTNLDSIVQHPALKISAIVSCAQKQQTTFGFCASEPDISLWMRFDRKEKHPWILFVSPAPIYSTNIYFVSPSPCRRKRLGFLVVGVSFPALPFISNLEIRKYGRVFHGISQDLPFLVLSERMKSHVPFKRPEIFSDSIAMGLHGETTYGETFGEAVQVNFKGSIRMVKSLSTFKWRHEHDDSSYLVGGFEKPPQLEKYDDARQFMTIHLPQLNLGLKIPKQIVRELPPPSRWLFSKANSSRSMRSIEPPFLRWTTMSQYSRVWRWWVTEMMVSRPNSCHLRCWETDSVKGKMHIPTWKFKQVMKWRFVIFLRVIIEITLNKHSFEMTTGNTSEIWKSVFERIDSQIGPCWPPDDYFAGWRLSAAHVAQLPGGSTGCLVL